MSITNFSPFANWVQNKAVEDPVKSAYLHRPTQDHHIAHEAHHGASTKQQVKSLLSMFDGHNLFVVDVLKYAFKGAFLGTLFGVSAGLMLKNFNSLAIRKISHYVTENTFAQSKLWKNAAIPYAFAGAGAGVTFYGFYHCFWTRESQRSQLFDMTTGYSIYTTALVSALVHPGLWWAGAFGGFALGFFHYYVKYGNVTSSQATPGFSIPIGKISEEDREKQRVKDLIHRLGQQPHIKYNALSEV